MKIHFLEHRGRTINCEINKRRNSKNLRMHINSKGIVKVSIPYYTTYGSAISFIDKNVDWIEKKLHHFNEQKNKYYYLGHNINIIKIYSTNNKYFNYIENISTLEIVTDDNSISESDLFFQFLKKKANEYIPQRVEELAAKFDFKYNSVKIKLLSSSWGSCSAKKNLSFNLKLMYFNYKVIDYVIIHELCHLKIMNHSREFWKLVEGIIPDYRERKSELNK